MQYENPWRLVLLPNYHCEAGSRGALMKCVQQRLSSQGQRIFSRAFSSASYDDGFAPRFVQRFLTGGGEQFHKVRFRVYTVHCRSRSKEVLCDMIVISPSLRTRLSLPLYNIKCPHINLGDADESAHVGEADTDPSISLAPRFSTPPLQQTRFLRHGDSKTRIVSMMNFGAELYYPTAISYITYC
ncbi:hypothetical protein EJ02DRAFT_196151 [Clathrospora elynae]|uniref:Uncharacterized protein n=1 Tax=Clathrospora elynae TaxID=706981 RepID=A0A6A5TD01_9PLEO|nr:hypothetical protein EJ02DRAFT_196151 [Clathrospora elynae]